MRKWTSFSHPPPPHFLYFFTILNTPPPPECQSYPSSLCSISLRQVTHLPLSLPPPSPSLSLYRRLWVLGDSSVTAVDRPSRVALAALPQISVTATREAATVVREAAVPSWRPITFRACSFLLTPPNHPTYPLTSPSIAITTSSLPPVSPKHLLHHMLWKVSLHLNTPDVNHLTRTLTKYSC